MRYLGLAVLAACSSGSELSGTLAYCASDLSVHIRDLGTGADALVDPGQFGSVTISPDARHVSYQGLDQTTKIADGAGHVTALPGRGCTGPATWLTNTALGYCVSGGTDVLAQLGGTPRTLPDYGYAISADGSTIAYVDQTGNVIVEALDGSSSRVLVPASDPTTPSFSIEVAAFTPDQQSLILEDSSAYPTALRVVSLATGASVDIADAFFMGTPFEAPRFLGASRFSSDGSELLVQSTTAVVAVSLATGAKRTIATFADRQSGAGGVFLSDGRVLWVRVDDHSIGDMGSFALSVHIAGPAPTDDVVLDGPGGPTAHMPTIAISPAGFIAMPSDVLVVGLDGTVLVRNDDGGGRLLADDILGLTPDGKTVITSSIDGPVHAIDAGGGDRLLVTTGFGTQQIEATGPFAAYTPN